jgi:hypothetical protein
MGIFYNPPPPPTASTAGTLPEPHVPIGTQGSEPPRRSIALLMVAVLASWPQDLEPRLGKPNNERTTIAPLTLTYGQQPPLVGTSVPADYELVLASWPPDLEPRFSWPNHVRQTIAPLTLPRGDPPPVVGASAIDEAVIIASWPLDLEPRLARPNNARVSIAPLTLTYGTQPSPQPPLAGPAFAAISAWPQPAWSSQAAPKSLAWFVPPGTAPYTPYPYAVIGASWPADLEPRLTRPNDRRQTIVTLTLPTGTSPPPQPPLGLAELVTIVGSWPTSWDAQSGGKNAAWNVPPLLVSLPYTPLPRLIWQAWEPPWIQPPAPVVIAPLTLVYGAQPPPAAGLSSSDITALVASWATTWDAQTAPKSAAWNVPPILVQVPYAVLPQAIRSAWEPPWIQPQRLIAIAPLTLIYGQAPPLRSAIVLPNVQAITSWPSDLEPRLIWPNVPQVKIAPLTLVYGTPPRPGPPMRPGVYGAVLTWHPPEKWPAQRQPPSIIWLIPPGPPPANLIQFINDALRATTLQAASLRVTDLVTETLTVSKATAAAATKTDFTTERVGSPSIDDEDLKDSD